jgi:hypothetical protein
MVIRALDEVEADITQTREEIQRRRLVIEELQIRGVDAKTMLEAELVLLGLERHLEVLLESQNSILHTQRRARASRIGPEPVRTPRRKSN